MDLTKDELLELTNDELQKIEGGSEFSEAVFGVLGISAKSVYYYNKYGPFAIL